MITQIQSLLQGHPWLPHLVYLESVDSTNNYAKQLAAMGAPEGTVVLAGQQTGGRGRLGRSFSSPAGMGLYMTVLLRPDCRPEELMHLTCAAGLSASDAVADVTGRIPGIKWTNDLILDRRKLGGILTELSIENGKVAWAIVGIGINCLQTARDFPPEIRQIAISLGLSSQQLPALAAALIQRLHQMRLGLLDEKEQLLSRFRARCITIGEQVSIVGPSRTEHGMALDIAPDGSLMVQLEDGSIRAVSSGEVSIRGMYGYV